eukprot:3021564-Rhodomonas_salina.1
MVCSGARHGGACYYTLLLHAPTLSPTVCCYASALPPTVCCYASALTPTVCCYAVVHGMGGAWGLIAVGIFCSDANVTYA